MRETTLCLLMKGAPPQRVLLGLKKEGFGAGKITGFGGKIEPGETPAAAAIRELEEETGIRVTSGNLCAIGQLQFLFPSRPAWSQLVHAAMGYAMDEQEAQNQVRLYIFRLRRKLEADPTRPHLIRTVRGRGYFLSLS